MPGHAWDIPLFDLDLEEEEHDAILRVLHRRWLSQGPETQAFEEELAEYLGTRFALLTSSGTTALHLAYLAIGLEPGDEVIVPSFTFVATVNPLLWMEVHPVFADIHSPTRPLLTRETVEPRITPLTKAIVFVAYAGNPQGVEDLRDLAEERGLYLIEDASHAMGSESPAGKPGSIGHVGCFSFFSNKTLPVGEGGALVTSDPKIYEKAKRLRSHGMTSVTWDRYAGDALTYDVIDLGYNYRASELEAALGRVKLQKLNQNVAQRREIVRWYRQEITRRNLPVEFIENPVESSAHYIFPILVRNKETRDRLMHFMKTHRIQTSIHYPPVHLFTFYRRYLGTHEGLLPQTEEAGRRELTLPLFPHLTLEQLTRVVDTLEAFFHDPTLYPDR